MNRLLIFIAALSCAAASPALAEQYWIAYEGNDFPENEGWTRIWNPPLADRWIEDGALVIDSRENIGTAEWYEWYPPSLDPGPGELFLVEWRLKIDEVTMGPSDTTVMAFSDERWAVAFSLNEDTIESVFEDGVSAEFEPGLFHQFEMCSNDMRTYELRIDGALAIQGAFWFSLTSSMVGWADDVPGSASLTRWDYFRFGVVPEPGAAAAMFLLASGALKRRPRRHNT